MQSRARGHWGVMLMWQENWVRVVVPVEYFSPRRGWCDEQMNDWVLKGPEKAGLRGLGWGGGGGERQAKTKSSVVRPSLAWLRSEPLMCWQLGGGRDPKHTGTLTVWPLWGYGEDTSWRGFARGFCWQRVNGGWRKVCAGEDAEHV